MMHGQKNIKLFQVIVYCIFCFIMNRYFLFSFFFFHFLLITFLSSCETFEMIYESKLSFSLRFFTTSSFGIRAEEFTVRRNLFVILLPLPLPLLILLFYEVS